MVESEWTTTNQLLAMLIDRVAHLEWVYRMAHTPEDKRTDPPPWLPRPGVKGDEHLPKKAEPKQVTDFFGIR